MSANSREALTGRAEVFKEAVRTFLQSVARGEMVKDRGRERAAVVRNIVADMVGEEGLKYCKTVTDQPEPAGIELVLPCIRSGEGEWWL